MVVDQDTRVYDPGPVPQVVEPEPAGQVVTVTTAGRTIHVIGNLGGTGLTGLAMQDGQHTITAALPAPSVEALVAGLVLVTPAPNGLAGDRR